MKFRCINCGLESRRLPIDDTRCTSCGDILDFVSDREVSVAALQPPPPEFSLWRYAALLPDFEDRRIVTLSEGGTTLNYAERLGGALGIDELFLKVEGKNPTGSFKDRGMSVAITAASAAGYKNALCASTGNTAASMAAYCSKAGIRSTVLVPRGKVTGPKLVQAFKFGARILEVEGNFDAALELVRNVQGHSVAIMNSINPFRIEGQKTVSFEICDQLGGAPDWVIIPVGNGGNITACWKGFLEFRKLGATGTLPRMVAVQAAGASPIANAVAQGKEEPEFVINPDTVASAIRIGRPANWRRAMNAVRDSGGVAVSVTDSEIVDARNSIADTEGILVELASAATVAALRKLIASGVVKHGESVVCILTGNGLKDIEAEKPETEIVRGRDALLSALMPGAEGG